jgi:HK97 family phage major capsid protein
MDKDPIEELAGNIGSLIDRLGKLEKDSDEYKNGIHQLQEKAGRFRGGSQVQTGLADNLSNAFSENREGLSKLSTKERTDLNFQVKAAGSDMVSLPTGAAATISMVPGGVIAPPVRPYHLRELFPQYSLNTAQLAYLKETSIDGGISPTKMGSIKPQLDYNLTETLAPAQTIAGFVRIASQLLDDIPYLLSYLSYRLAENLLVAEDNQILNGDGNTPNLSGILLAANHTAKTGSATIFAEKLMQAAGQLAGYNRRVSGIVVNPTDYYNMFILAGTGSGVYTVPFGMALSPTGQVTFLGIPLIWNAAITSGNYLVGDFANGSGLWFRQMMNVQVFYQDAYNVQMNMVTIRCEERVAMPVYNAQAFIYPT